MLLDDIIDLAADNKQSITVLLRKCLVLATQLKNERLKSWANQELNGYSSEEGLPDYRVTPAQAKGHFSGPFGSGWNYLPIPPAVLEKEHQQFALRVPLFQAISAYEDMVSNSSNSGSITVQWPANLVLYYQSKISPGMSLIAAYQEISRGSLVEMLDAVRNRTLNMALELKTELGEVQDVSMVSGAHAVQIERVVVSNIGGNVYVSTGQSNMNATTIQQQSIVAGDWEHLAKVLRNSGLSGPELDELSTAVKEDGRTMGTKVKGWIAKTAPKVLSGGVKIGAAIGQSLLTEYLKQYCGLP